MHTRGYQEIITSERSFVDLGLAELWSRRALLWALVKRDLRVRYKNTFLGVIWVVLQPALSTLIFTLVLARVFNSNNDSNYLLSTLTGFTLWQFFSSCIGAASGSVYEQAGIIRKIYFPRAYIPLTIVFRQLFDYGIGTIFLIAAMCWQHVWPTSIGIVAYILGIVNIFLWAAGLGLITSALSVMYRDVRHLVPFIVQIWFYLTPVFYDRGLLSGKLELIAHLNPVTGILEFVRAGLLAGQIDLWAWGLQLILGVAVAAAGLAFFRRKESELIDRA